MTDVKLNNLELATIGRLRASAPQQSESQQVSQGIVGSKTDDITSQEVDKSIQSELVGERAKEQTERVKEAVTKLNDYVQTVQRDLQFSMDKSSGKTVITVVDRNTNEVVRQIPDDLALKLAQNLQQDEPLSLFNVTV